MNSNDLGYVYLISFENSFHVLIGVFHFMLIPEPSPLITSVFKNNSLNSLLFYIIVLLSEKIV